MPSDLPQAFGCVLRVHRKRKGWSQMTCATEAGMHLNALGNLERGMRNPSLQTIFLLCEALGVGVGEFMADVEAEIKRDSRRRKT